MSTEALALPATISAVQSALPEVQSVAEATGLNEIVWARLHQLKASDPVEIRAFFGLDPIRFDELWPAIALIFPEIVGPDPFGTDADPAPIVAAAAVKVSTAALSLKAAVPSAPPAS